MAKLVNALNQTLDGYIDHDAPVRRVDILASFPPNAALNLALHGFHRIASHCGGHG